jgi:predicted  nucleic acid-binding Zn-ribbon protein
MAYALHRHHGSEEAVMTEGSRREQTLDKLRRERDEIRLKLHLGKAELKEEWEALERKWEHLEGRMAGARDEARQASRDVGTAFGVLADELGEAYRRIRAKLG